MKELFRLVTGYTVEQMSDNLVQFYIDKSETAVLNYVNKDITKEELEKAYPTQIVSLAEYFYKNKSITGIKSQSQGSRSISYQDSLENYGIPAEIRQTLPRYVRLI